VDGNDAIYRHPVFEKYLKDERIINIAKKILNASSGLELQHSKLNSKPLQDKGAGLIEWHQDYPFFPHTNLDLVAVGIHFDDEDEDSGSMRVVPGSHKLGILSHCDEEGKFVYKCTDQKFDDSKTVLMTCPAGTVTVHHCLTLHQSSPKRNDKHRRFLVYQVRTDDNIQISGVLWKCTGYEITGSSKNKGRVRFMDGTSVENRGVEGRLYDKFAKLAPNK
jgi:ectoine hydroxylase-related dioxygenase (phytanoyl-CoA dioxygenase family)